MTRIEITGLTKYYGALAAVDDLDLRVREHEFLTLLGPSGCGKTTTLRCVAGLERPERGCIRIGDDLVTSAEDLVFVPPNKRDVGVVFQNYALWPHMTVFGNVAYPLQLRHVKRPDIKRQVEDAVAMVGLIDYLNRPATQLSGGQQQRVALARAMVCQPRVALFDEPLSNLDATLRASLRSEIRAIHDRVGTTSIYVTHDQAEAMALSDRVVVMSKGRIQQIGTPREVYVRPRNRFVADFVGVENFIEGKVVDRASGTVTIQPRGGDRTLRCSAGATRSVNGAVVVAVRSDCISIVRAGAADTDTNVVSGTVRTCVYTGGHVEYGVDTAGTTLTVRQEDADQDESNVLRPGAEVQLWINPELAVALMDDTDQVDLVEGGSDPLVEQEWQDACSNSAAPAGLRGDV